MLEKLKYRVYDILVETDDDELIDKIVAVFLMLLILVNVAAMVLETVDSLNQQYGAVFYWIEIVSITIFTIEYLLRLWVCTLTPKYSHPIKGRIRYAFSALAIVDLLAILPAFLPLIFTMDMRVIRILRLFRLFRLLKMHRYVESLNTLDDVVRNKKEELIVTTIMLTTLLLFASSLMFVIENDAQPDKFPDIPTALWWGIATLTTVGYGDVFPVTMLGKLLGGIIAFLGIGMFALPTGILASGFASEIQKAKKKDCICCPKCEHEFELEE